MLLLVFLGLVCHLTFALSQVPVNGLWEWKQTADQAAFTRNPYNWTEIRCFASVTPPSPSAADDAEHTALGFYMEPYDDNGKKIGPGEWRVRYSPRTPGRYSMTVFLWQSGSAAGPRVLAGPMQFDAVPSKLPGLIAISPHNPRGFVDSASGQTYVPVGTNVVGMYTRGNVVRNMTNWLERLAREGRGTYFRCWTMDNVLQPANETVPGPYQLALETGPELGRYNQWHGHNLDQVLRLAERLGLRMLLTLIDQHSYRRTRRWPKNMFNQANGGPLTEPQQFLTDPWARAVVRQRFAYIVARYGYSSSIFALQFWNEIDFIDGYNGGVAAEWHREMIEFVRGLEQNGRHLLATSMAREKGDPTVERLAGLDFVTTHHYDNATYGGDMAGFVAGLCQLKASWYPQKPHFVGEFGVSPNPPEFDPHWQAWHNGVWASLTSHGCSGSAMSWFWTFIDNTHAWPKLAAAASFAQSIDWAHRLFSPVQASAIVVSSSSSSVNHNGTLKISLRSFAKVGRRHLPQSVGDNSDVQSDDILLLLWLQAWPATTWRQFNSTGGLPQVDQATVQLSGLDGGTYDGVWLDTRVPDKILGRTTAVRCDTGYCVLPVPVSFQGDVALKLWRTSLPPQLG